MGRLSDVHARLSCFPEVTARIATLRAEMAAVAADSPHATLVRLWCSYGAESDRYLPLSLAPILDRALIAEGIAVGWHSAPPRGDMPREIRDGDGRLLIGRLIHAAKQYDAPMWSTDSEDVQAMGSLAAWALAATRFGREVDLIVSVPSSRGTNALPHQIARDLAFLTGIRYASADAIRFGRVVPQAKTIHDVWISQEIVNGSMDADPDAVRGRAVLVIDDVCRTGTTLHEAARACFRAGARCVTALVLSKSWQYQQVPAAWPSMEEVEQ